MALSVLTNYNAVAVHGRSFALRIPSCLVIDGELRYGSGSTPRCVRPGRSSFSGKLRGVVPVGEVVNLLLGAVEFR